MRKPETGSGLPEPRCVLTIAGSDSGGGAGIQADLKTITVLGGFGMSAITALTAQNTREVTAIQTVSPEFVLRQIEAVATDLPIHSAKTGMLANREIVEAVAQGIGRFQIPNLVVDPVFISKGGHPLLAEDAVEALTRSLFPLADLITPNLHEARILSGSEVESAEERREAARRLHAMGPGAVLIKGGHGEGPEAEDLLFDGSAFHTYSAPRFDTPHTHGTGCTLSAAIATFLAKGLELAAAVEEAKRFITEAIRLSFPLGGGHGPTNHYAAGLGPVERDRVLGSLARAATAIRDRTLPRETLGRSPVQPGLCPARCDHPRRSGRLPGKDRSPARRPRDHPAACLRRLPPHRQRHSRRHAMPPAAPLRHEHPLFRGGAPEGRGEGPGRSGIRPHEGAERGEGARGLFTGVGNRRGNARNVGGAGSCLRPGGCRKRADDSHSGNRPARRVAQALSPGLKGS